ncbi:GyrI-like domain-containing protein [Motiliproteus sp. MSK22-1]|uniref:AraC family transcriptional regulator n=1 Tax=Motiliproteus sp. MSK22-1 TaxID=1897630 RepID=UPI000978126E|nr:AraC family transcriptional regulator [Motiliproteus sp. MSK22-1]OMH27128.1 AraC family transcriptional regulator [Motiliproteus sp. MSK22-1]
MNDEKRYYRVLEYIDSHVDEDLSVDLLSQVACLSKYHFHRQFSALFGITVSDYVGQVRMKRASYLLAFRKESPIIDVALASGYKSPEAFSRAFNQSVGQSPSVFRALPHWNPWHQKFQLLKDLRIQNMKTQIKDHPVDIVVFDETKVAVLEHRDAPEKLGHSIRQFIEWRKENKLPPSKSRTFNIVYDDPSVTLPENYRFDLCASVKSEVAENAYGIVTKSIPAGRCAVIRHLGSDDTIGESIQYLYSDWLPTVDEELRDFPLFFERLSFFPDIAEHQMVTDIYLPLK